MWKVVYNLVVFKELFDFGYCFEEKLVKFLIFFTVIIELIVEGVRLDVLGVFLKVSS